MDFVKPTRSLLNEMKVHTLEKEVYDSGMGGDVHELKIKNYQLWLFDDMIIIARIKKDKFKFEEKILMDKVAINSVTNIPKEGKTSHFFAHFFMHH